MSLRALALREAARRQSTYVIVPEDPLAEVAAAWRTMWDVTAAPGGAAGFEERAAEALAAYRDRRFDLPDYYLVVASVQLTSVQSQDDHEGYPTYHALCPRRTGQTGA